MRSSLRWTLTALFLFTFLSTNSIAQVSATISGTITDKSAATVPSTSITARNVETGAEQTVADDESGHYQFISLPVGTYEIHATRAGFNEAVHSGIHLAVGQHAVVNIALQVGDVHQQVIVTGDAPAVSTTTED